MVAVGLPMPSHYHPRGFFPVHLHQRLPDCIPLGGAFLKVMLSTHDDEVSFSVIEEVPGHGREHNSEDLDNHKTCSSYYEKEVLC